MVSMRYISCIMKSSVVSGPFGLNVACFGAAMPERHFNYSAQSGVDVLKAALKKAN